LLQSCDYTESAVELKKVVFAGVIRASVTEHLVDADLLWYYVVEWVRNIVLGFGNKLTAATFRNY